jgi:hypothetical protein
MASGASSFSSIRLLLAPLVSSPFLSPLFTSVSSLVVYPYFGHLVAAQDSPPIPHYFIPEYFACLWNLLHTWGWMVYITAWRDWPGAGDADGHYMSWAMEWIYAYLGFYFFEGDCLNH